MVILNIRILSEVMAENKNLFGHFPDNCGLAEGKRVDVYRDVHTQHGDHRVAV
jgi:hypothetical protein